MKCNLSKIPIEICLRVTLLCLDESRLKAIGFRLEEWKTHQFYHAQFISDLGPSDVANQLLCPEWIPDSQPSFPVPADCPVSLILCLLLTLYGLKDASRICNDYNVHKLQPYIAKLKPYVGLLTDARNRSLSNRFKENQENW